MLPPRDGSTRGYRRGDTDALRSLATVLEVPDHAVLREHVRPIGFGQVGEGAGDDLFRVAEAVDGGRVDPVDTALDGVTNGGDRVGVILRAPAERPVTAADRPRAESDARDVHARRAERVRGEGGLVRHGRLSGRGECGDVVGGEFEAGCLGRVDDALGS